MGDVSVGRAKITEIASRITGAEDGEIEIDTPLMEAGLTSNSAILLRDELSQELPGISLPVTLVFDYPSIGAMTDLITSQGKRGGTYQNLEVRKWPDLDEGVTCRLPLF